MKKIDIYEGDISKFKKKKEELMKMLIEEVDRDMRLYFKVSVKNFSDIEEIKNVNDWINAYWENLHWHLSHSIKRFLEDNGYGIDDLMVNASSIFKEMIEKRRKWICKEKNYKKS